MVLLCINSRSAFTSSGLKLCFSLHGLYMFLKSVVSRPTSLCICGGEELGGGCQVEAAVKDLDSHFVVFLKYYMYKFFLIFLNIKCFLFLYISIVGMNVKPFCNRLLGCRKLKMLGQNHHVF